MYFNKDWKFFRGECEGAWYRGFDDSSWCSVTLPHDASVECDFDINESSGTGYLPGGTLWYRKEFDIPADYEKKRLFVTFGGVYNNSRVWCNSNYLGKRPYGYSSFTYELTEFLKADKNVLSVKVSRPETADSRWFTGTGIYRDVKLSVTGRYSLRSYDSIFVRSEVCENEATLFADYKIDGGKAKTKFTLLDKCGKKVASATRTAEKGTVALKVRNPNLWSADEPYLYKLSVTVFDGEEISDSEEINVGIRSLTFDCDNGFFVNGVFQKLKGVCVHHDSGALGAAFYKSVWKRRLENLRKAGCNAIRTSHNPPDPLLLDLCDEMGFYVMDEAFDEWEGFKNKWWHGHNVYPPKHFGYADDFHEWHEKDLADMVLRDRNHPSVVMWSIGNEIDYPNDPYGYFAFESVTGNNDANKPLSERKYSDDRPDARRLTVMAKELVSIVKKHDMTRPVTAALSFPEMCEYIGITDVLDIAGYNYKEKFYAGHRKLHPNRFVFGSENGHSQAQWNYVRDNDDICGQFLWTGIDYLGEARGWPFRASGAGILDLGGFAKGVRFDLRKMMWTDERVLEIYHAVDDYTYNKSWNFENGEKVKIAVVTNLGTPVIRVNGKECGEMLRGEDNFYLFEVPFEKGEITAEAEELISSMKTHGRVKKICIDAYEETDSIREMKLCQYEVRLYDENSIPVEDCDTEVFVSVSGGELLGIENGDITDLTPYYSQSRKTYLGRLIAYVRADINAEPEVTFSLKGGKIKAEV